MRMMAKKIENRNGPTKGEIVLYQSQDGKAALDVRLDRETVWLTQDQMADLFGRERSVITKHLRNVFKEGELEEASVCAKFAHTAADGKTYQVQSYNLDVIISVGYRVKSKRGTQFRIWATNVLRDHLVRGFTLNEKRLLEQEQKLADLRSTVGLLEQTLAHQAIGLDEAKGLLKVLTDYAYALTTLDRFDHGTLAIEEVTRPAPYIMTYESAMEIINAMQPGFGGLFGLEKDQGFKSALGAVYQTFGGEELYPSIEEKAANLLYFVVKNHAFSDGNKRIAAALFIAFLAGNKALYHNDGSKRIADNALVAITLMIAESNPADKETMVKLIVNLINSRN
ncbi:Death-on-curing family protein [uncultured Desulfobacterium sp.]|uniref:Death-on-curing family protein n=1 Tax=uncultured Desulfobacterium sp. TaxID=201089 RepID=A0A445MVB8_9BACT|nr:Death-on-curing family protein [uncultured Desulfobacterium sp.]